MNYESRIMKHEAHKSTLSIYDSQFVIRLAFIIMIF